MVDKGEICYDIVIIQIGEKKMGINVEGYFQSMQSPWGQLFYKILWNHLEFEGKQVLDFGSGFGITANHLAKKNQVIAIEPNEEVLEYRFTENPYQQLIGSIERLKELPDQSFDVIICHNVLEYVEDRKAVIHELTRLLKNDGFISLVKHNIPGVIMQKAVFQYNIDDCMKLLDGEHVGSANFGVIREYTNSNLESYINGELEICNQYGIRTFYALQSNDIKHEEDWITRMFELETRVEQIEEFRNISFFHHFELRKML